MTTYVHFDNTVQATDLSCYRVERYKQ